MLRDKGLMRRLICVERFYFRKNPTCPRTIQALRQRFNAKTDLCRKILLSEKSYMPKDQSSLGYIYPTFVHVFVVQKIVVITLLRCNVHACVRSPVRSCVRFVHLDLFESELLLCMDFKRILFNCPP